MAHECEVSLGAKLVQRIFIYIVVQFYPWFKFYFLLFHPPGL